MKKICGIIILIVASAVEIYAQGGENVDIVRRHRISRIDIYHVSFGITAGANENLFHGPRLSFGMGSYRNVINADCGFRYIFLNTLPLSLDERISMQQLPLFVSLSANIFRWKMNSLYLGAEMTYVLSVNSHHHIESVSLTDMNLRNNHFAATTKAGTNIDNIDFNVFCLYRFGPAFNQKHIFESSDYEYNNLRSCIYERYLFGIEIIYHFAL